MDWAAAVRGFAAWRSNYTILARFSPPASELRPEFPCGGLRNERSIFGDARDAPPYPEAFRARPGSGSSSGVERHPQARGVEIPGGGPARSAVGYGRIPAYPEAGDERISASAAARPGSVAPGSAQAS